jgi:hypothetical protein
MSPKSHAMLFQAFVLLSIPFILIYLIGFMSTQSTITTVTIFLADSLAYLAIRYLIPVSCQAPRCRGRTKRTMTRVNFWKTRVEYTCKTCSTVYREEIFLPNIQSDADDFD